MRQTFVHLVATLALILPQFGHAADPLEIEGAFTTTALSSVTLSAKNVGGSNYEFRVKEDVSVPSLGCVIEAGQLFLRLTSTSPDSFFVDTFFPTNSSGCRFLQRSSFVPATLIVRTGSITVDIVNSSRSDLTFARVTPKDAVVPLVQAFSASGKRGGKVQILYTVTDDSGSAAETVTIYRGRRVVKIFSMPIGVRTAGTVRGVIWTAPRRASTGYRFEVVAVDAANNKSKIAAGKITLTE